MIVKPQTSLHQHFWANLHFPKVGEIFVYLYLIFKKCFKISAYVGIIIGFVLTSWPSVPCTLTIITVLFPSFSLVGLFSLSDSLMVSSLSFVNSRFCSVYREHHLGAERHLHGDFQFRPFSCQVSC